MLSAKETLVLTAIIMFFGLGIIFLAMHRDKTVSHMQELCEAKGGILLEHTYRMGKTENYNYVCIDPKVVIEY